MKYLIVAALIIALCGFAGPTTGDYEKDFEKDFWLCVNELDDVNLRHFKLRKKVKRLKRK